jgi:hypothetical protein
MAPEMAKTKMPARSSTTKVTDGSVGTRREVTVARRRRRPCSARVLA